MPASVNDIGEEERAVGSLHFSRPGLIVGGRRIRVLLDTGKLIKPKDTPMEALKAAERQIEAEQGQVEEPEGSRSLETRGLRNSHSPVHINSVTANGVENEETNGIDEDEITAIPIQERPGRDIKFSNLPHPGKHERSDSEGPLNEDVG